MIKYIDGLRVFDIELHLYKLSRPSIQSAWSVKDPTFAYIQPDNSNMRDILEMSDTSDVFVTSHSDIQAEQFRGFAVKHFMHILHPYLYSAFSHSENIIHTY